MTGAAAALRHGARILAAMAVDSVARSSRGHPTWRSPRGRTPPASRTGFVVAADDGSRLHFLDWGGCRGATTRRQPACSSAGPPPAGGVVVAGRAAGRPGEADVAADLRGQGLSDAPMTGYDPATLAAMPSRSRRAPGCSPAADRRRGPRVRRRSSPSRGRGARGAVRGLVLDEDSPDTCHIASTSDARQCKQHECSPRHHMNAAGEEEKSALDVCSVRVRTGSG